MVSRLIINVAIERGRVYNPHVGIPILSRGLRDYLVSVFGMGLWIPEREVAGLWRGAGRFLLRGSARKFPAHTHDQRASAASEREGLSAKRWSGK